MYHDTFIGLLRGAPHSRHKCSSHPVPVVVRFGIADFLALLMGFVPIAALAASLAYSVLVAPLAVGMVASTAGSASCFSV